MGFKPHRAALTEVFENYRRWFQQAYLAGLAMDEDDEALEWSGPFEKLLPLPPGRLTKLENEVGELPQSYRNLVLDFGVGQVLVATEEEPVEFTILSPEQIPQVKKDCLSWIDKDLLHRAQDHQGIDASKLLPILVDRDWNQWVLLANQSDRDDRVLLFSHEQEQREDTDLFSDHGSVEAYFGKLFEAAKNLYSPWYLWNGHK